MMKETLFKTFRLCNLINANFKYLRFLNFQIKLSIFINWSFLDNLKDKE